MCFKYSQPEATSLELDIIEIIENLETSGPRFPLTFNKLDMPQIKNLKIIQIICQDIKFKINKLYIVKEKINTIIVHPKVSSFGFKCFSDCLQLVSITLPNSISSLGDYCFSQCSQLKSLTFPNSIISLEDYCFSLCSKLKSFTIPN
jgi:hypothetical protein